MLMGWSVKKNRFAAVTGPGGALYFDKDTYMITERIIPQHDMPPTEVPHGSH